MGDQCLTLVNHSAPLTPGGEASKGDYPRVKARIDQALDTLREELVLMQNQDQALLRQLLKIHFTILTLTGKRSPHRRSYSSSSMGSPTSPTSSHTFIKTPLERRSSEPIDRMRDNAQDDDVDDEDYDDMDDEYENELAKSFNSCLSSGSSDWGLDMEREMTDVVHPLPAAFRKKRISSQSSPRITNKNMMKQFGLDDITETPVTSAKNGMNAQYEVSYGNLLKCSSALWKTVENDKENGIRDKKKITTLKLFL